jgi:hypothetical protein
MLLFTIPRVEWLLLVFPLWVLVVSIQILRGSLFKDAGRGAGPPSLNFLTGAGGTHPTASGRNLKNDAHRAVMS